MNLFVDPALPGSFPGKGSPHSTLEGPRVMPRRALVVFAVTCLLGLVTDVALAQLHPPVLPIGTVDEGDVREPGIDLPLVATLVANCAAKLQAACDQHVVELGNGDDVGLTVLTSPSGAVVDVTVALDLALSDPPAPAGIAQYQGRLQAALTALTAAIVGLTSPGSPPPPPRGGGV